MGIVLTDYVVESVIRDGLKDLRDRPEIIDDLFSTLLSSYLGTDYGQEVLNHIKTYILENKIHVVQSFRLASAKIPCFSINLGEAVEDESKANHQDYGDATFSAITADVVVSSFSANSYNSVTGAVSIPDGIDASLIKIKHILVDTLGNNYPITGGIITTTGNKQFNIGKGLAFPPDLTGLVQIISNVSQDVVEHGVVPIREKIEIGIYAQNDPNVCKWLYYLLMYFLHQKRDVLEARCVQLSNITASDFGRVPELEGENIFARYVTLTCLTYFDWEQVTLPMVGGIGVDILVPKDVVVTSDVTRTVNTEL